MNKSKNSIRSISNSANILICLSNGINSLTEIATICNLPKPTVHRLLKALEDSQFVIKDISNHRYYLGYLVHRLVSIKENAHKQLILLSINEMKHLSNLSEETVILHVMIGIQHIRLYDIPSKYDVSIPLSGDGKAPLFLGAVCRSLFSQIEDIEIEAIINRNKIGQSKKEEAVEKETLISHLKQVKQQGYAITFGELLDGSIGISAPIHNYFYPATLSILGSEYRLKPKINYIVEELKTSASHISEYLAGTSS